MCPTSPRLSKSTLWTKEATRHSPIILPVNTSQASSPLLLFNLIYNSSTSTFDKHLVSSLFLDHTLKLHISISRPCSARDYQVSNVHKLASPLPFTFPHHFTPPDIPKKPTPFENMIPIFWCNSLVQSLLDHTKHRGLT